VRVTRPDGSAIEVRADRVREMDADALRVLADQLAAMAWSGDDVAGEPGFSGDAGD
jgi:hypothetical protein